MNFSLINATLSLHNLTDFQTSVLTVDNSFDVVLLLVIVIFIFLMCVSLAPIWSS